MSEEWERGLEELERYKSSQCVVNAVQSREERKAERRAADAVLDAQVKQKQHERQQAPPRVVVTSELERARQRHNAAVKQARLESSANRSAFFQKHRAVLEEFGARVPSIPEGAQVTSKSLPPQITPPPQITATMRDYQLEGLRFLEQQYEHGVNAILGDEMGLGKTLQTIAFLAHLKYEKGLTGPSLVVAPLSVLSSWLVECKKFCPSLRVVKLHSSDSEERDRLKAQVMNHWSELDVVVTT